MAPRNLPIRSKLALMFVGVCLVTFGVGGYLVSASATAVLEREILARLEYQSRAYATALDGYLRMLTRRSEDFASDGFIRDHLEALVSGAGGARDPARLRGELRAHLLENKLPLVTAFLDLTLMGPDGAVLLPARRPPPPGFAEGLPADPEGRWFSGLLPPRPGDGHPLLAIATPILSRDRSEGLGRLVAWVHPAVWIVDALRARATDEEGTQEGVTLQLVDAEGAVLRVSRELTDPAGPRPDSELVRTGFGLELTAAGVGPGHPPEAGIERGVFSRSFPIAANGWSVRVVLRGKNLLAATASLQSRFLAVGATLSIAACLLFFFPMRFLTRPLVDLAAAARRLADGDLAARVAVETDDEIGELGRSFNSMAEAIEERTSRQERTAQDLRQRQSELGSERDRLKAVISSMRDGLVVLDPEGKPVVHNRTAGPLLKQLESAPLPMEAYHICDGSETLNTECRTCLFSPEVGPRSCVVKIDGGVFEIHAAKLPPDASGRSGRVLVSRDVTDRIAQDERQIHQERLAVLGEVAAVMAHELNNPLAAISMYNQMLAMELQDRPELAESVEVIQRNVESCTQTIRDLLGYATNTTPQVDSVDVHATLQDVSAFLRPLRDRSKVELRMNVSPEPLEVHGDEVQIRQVFVNLMVNAIQAAPPQGGWVSIETSVEEGHAVVHVADNGRGVSREVREEIFRPFFTTKGRGEGTGLGLPTARRIAEMHGGGLDLVDTDDGCTVFRVRLRLSPEAAA